MQYKYELISERAADASSEIVSRRYRRATLPSPDVKSQIHSRARAEYFRTSENDCCIVFIIGGARDGRARFTRQRQ